MLFDSPRQRQLRKRKKIRQSLWVEKPLDRRRSSSVSAFQEEIAKLKNEFAATDGGGGGGDDNNDDDDDDDDDDNNQSRSRSNANRTGRDRHNSDTATAEEPRAKPHADDIRFRFTCIRKPAYTHQPRYARLAGTAIVGRRRTEPRSRAVPLNHHKTPRKKNRADVGGRYRLRGT